MWYIVKVKDVVNNSLISDHIVIPVSALSFLHLKGNTTSFGLAFWLAVILSYFSTPAFAQQTTIDSLEKKLSSTTLETEKADILNDLAWFCSYQNLEMAEKYGQQAVALCTKLHLYKLRSSAYNTIGIVYEARLSHEQALRFYRLSLADKELVNDLRGKATVLNNMGIVFKNAGALDSALAYYQASLQLHTLKNNETGKAEVLNNLGVFYRNKGEFKRSNNFFTQSLAISKQLGDKAGVATRWNNMASNFADRNEYDSAVKYFFQSAEVFEELGEKLTLVSLYANIGIMNQNLKNTERAKTYLLKAIKIGQKLKANDALLTPFNALAGLYFAEKEYQKSLHLYRKALAIPGASSGSYYAPDLHLGIGINLMAINQFAQAEVSILKAISLARARKQEKSLANALQQLGNLYLKTSRTSLSKAKFDEANIIASKFHYTDIQERSFASLAQYHRQLNQMDSMQIYLDQSLLVRDTLFSNKLAKQFSETQVQFESANKAEMKELKQTEVMAKQTIRNKDISLRNRTYGLLTSLAMLTLVVFTGIFYFKSRNLKNDLEKAKLVKQTEEEERNRISKDIHDELGSGLSRIVFLTEILNTKSKNNPEASQSLEAISKTAHLLVDNMRDLIWAMNPENTSLENLIARIREYSSDYLDEFPITLVNDFEADIPNVILKNEACRNIIMVVKEALQNTIKHANASVLTIQITIGSELKICLTDNGKGFNLNLSPKGNGLKNLATRIKDIGGNMMITSTPGEGTKVNFSAPISAMQKS